jgi:hypothetical protein
MPASADNPLQRVLSAPTWRARFFEAAANAAAALVEYSLRHQDAINAQLWMNRLRFFREKAKISSRPRSAFHPF